MQEAFKDLGGFQINLSQGDPALVTPKIATDVFSSIAYLDDKSFAKMARETFTTRKTMATYCNKDQPSTPNFNKFVHMMQRLGYEVYLKKQPTNGSV